jgi:hypothetical protein
MFRVFQMDVVMRQHRVGLLLAGVALSATLGCGGTDGPDRVAVTGTVLLDGQPLSSGVIRFIPTGETHGPAAAATITNGRYETTSEQGPVPGTHRVEIEATGYYGFAIDDEAAYVAQVEKNGGRFPANPVPEIYNRRSTLTAEVAASGQTPLDFALSAASQHTAQR